MCIWALQDDVFGDILTEHHTLLQLQIVWLWAFRIFMLKQYLFDNISQIDWEQHRVPSSEDYLRNEEKLSVITTMVKKNDARGPVQNNQ